MNKTNEALFKQALMEGLSNRIDRVIESCTETVVPSRRHRVAMRAIINGRTAPRRGFSPCMKRVAAILVAVMLLLAGCAVIYREQICNFIEEIYESFVKISCSEDEESGVVIKDVYELTYLPDGYSFENEFSSLGMSRIKYCDSNGNQLIFEQRNLDATKFYADIENGYTKIVDIIDYDVYHKRNKDHSYYIWNDGEYSFALISKMELSNEELQKIIDGIKMK